MAWRAQQLLSLRVDLSGPDDQKVTKREVHFAMSEVTRRDIEKLLLDYDRFKSTRSQSMHTQRGAHEWTRERVEAIVSASVDLPDVAPDRVLRALIELAEPEEKKYTACLIKLALKEVRRWQFHTPEKGRAFCSVLRQDLPDIASGLRFHRIIDRIFRASAGISDEKPERRIIAEELISLIPPLYNRMVSPEGPEDQADECRAWLEQTLKAPLPSWFKPIAIDMLLELPLTDEQSSELIETVIVSCAFEQLPDVVEHVFPHLRRMPKMIARCLYDVIRMALRVELEDDPGQDRTIAAIIKKLYTVCTYSRPVLEALGKGLVSDTEFPARFTPFLLSLGFCVSRLASRIRDSLQKAFMRQLEDDFRRTQSIFLSHIYNGYSDVLQQRRLETVVERAIGLAKMNLEGNVHVFVEFAFDLIDSAPRGSAHGEFRETSSELIPPRIRQIQIGVRILLTCRQEFPSSQNEISVQIVQRLTANAPNCVYLVQCLDTIDGLLEVIESIHHLELPVVEQLMRLAVPKIIGNEAALNRAVIIARKGFFNRTEKAKLNGVAALFYLMQPHQLDGYTQCFASPERYGQRLNAAASADLQHEIFSLLGRGIHREDTAQQADAVQKDIYFFMPFLLQQIPDLAVFIRNAISEKFERLQRVDQYPVLIARWVPDFFFCLSRCLRIAAGIPRSDWSDLSSRFDALCQALSNVEFAYLHDGMDIFGHPEERDIVTATVSVMFNHTFAADKDLALALFRLYDRIVHKRMEIERLRKESLKSTLACPQFMEISLLKQLFKLLAEESGDYTGNYGIQFYALNHASEMIKNLRHLRLEMRPTRLKRTITLGELLFNSLDSVKWAEAPAGSKSPMSLPDILTRSIQKLGSFVVKTYSEEFIKEFLVKCSLITGGQQIADSHIRILQAIKLRIRRDDLKCAEHFCCFAEQLARFGIYDDKFFKAILKILRQQINQHAPFAGRVLRLARSFAPKPDLLWLVELNAEVVEKLREEDAGGLSSALIEVIATIGDYLADIKWAVLTWIPQVRAADPEEHDRAAAFAERFAMHLLRLEEITDNLFKLDFNAFPPAYYEAMIKFLNKFYQTVNKLVKQTLKIPEVWNDSLEQLLSAITSDLDEKGIQFAIQNQRQDPKSSKTVSRQGKFDATYIPKLYGQIDTLRAAVKTMVEKHLAGEEIAANFCHLTGTDLSLPGSHRKKKQKEADDPDGNGEEPGEEEE
jgi:hypothetical protein